MPDSLVCGRQSGGAGDRPRRRRGGGPELGSPEQYIRVLDHNGYFEVTSLSEDDRKRNEMYRANALRAAEQASFTDYGAYLESLHMKAVIRPFEPLYMARIAQLTNKSNQFNLTTRRYTQTQIEEAAQDPSCVTLYGKLEDKFGDNGVVSVLIGTRRRKVRETVTGRLPRKPEFRPGFAGKPSSGSVADELPRPEAGHGVCHDGCACGKVPGARHPGDLRLLLSHGEERHGAGFLRAAGL